MAYLIGMDEAGYGPNLGPLVVCGTVWRVLGDDQDLDLYRHLAAAVDRTPSTSTHYERIAIADSKVLYRPASGLRLLERALLSCLGLLGKPVTSWQQLWDELAPESKPTRATLPWYRDFQCALPLASDVNEITSLTELLQRTCDSSHVRLISIASTAVFPGTFNDLIGIHGNKSTLLSLTTLSLVRRLLGELDQGVDAEPIYVLCDKHGGRNRYGALLQQTFPEYLVEIHAEGATESLYRWGPAGQRVEFCFQARGESFLPAALASVTAKYLREAAMRAFNSFWCDQIPGLRPTAGYPVDARRYRDQIESVRQRLTVDERDLWRMR